MQNFEPIFTNDGYRPNVGIIICNQVGQVFWARRINKDGWQFPQGGVSRNESLVDAMYREPGRRRVSFKGQKQVWFLLELTEDDSAVDLRAGPETPEFDSWRWVDTHHAIDNIVDFKRSVYQKALSEFEQFLPTS